jgi:DNA repair protein RecO (recombination protein O)
MQWTDEGIVLGVKRHGEANAILELMTREHGRHLGLVRGGAGSRLRPVLQPGNRLSSTWRARLDEHLGVYTVESLDARAASFLPVPHALYGMTHLAALCRLLAERDPHPQIHAALDAVLDGLLEARRAGPSVVRFELQLLAELGFGLDLASCAASGAETDLVYVSPKSGRAVSRQAGEPWQDKLLRLPPFLDDASMHEPSQQDIADGFALTGFFLLRHVLEPHGRGLADARASFIAAVLRDQPPPAGRTEPLTTRRSAGDRGATSSAGDAGDADASASAPDRRPRGGRRRRR